MAYDVDANRGSRRTRAHGFRAKNGSRDHVNATVNRKQSVNSNECILETAHKTSYASIDDVTWRREKHGADEEVDNVIKLLSPRSLSHEENHVGRHRYLSKSRVRCKRQTRVNSSNFLNVHHNFRPIEFDNDIECDSTVLSASLSGSFRPFDCMGVYTTKYGAKRLASRPILREEEVAEVESNLSKLRVSSGKGGRRGAIQKMFEAVSLGDLDCVRRLLSESELSVNTINNNSMLETPLMDAVRWGHFELSQMLIELGADLNLRNAHQRCALHIAMWKKHLAIVELLLNKGADCNARDADGWSAIHWAVNWPNASLASRLILVHRARLFWFDRHGHGNPLKLVLRRWLASKKEADIAEELLRVGSLLLEHGCPLPSQLFLADWFYQMAFIDADEVQPQLALFVLQLALAGGQLPLPDAQHVPPTHCNYSQVERLRDIVILPARLTHLCQVKIRCLLSEATHYRSLMGAVAKLPLPPKLKRCLVLTDA